MSAPVSLDIFTKYDFTLTVKLSDADGQAKQLGTYTIVSQIRTVPDGDLIADFEVLPVNLNEGEFSLFLDHDVTSLITETTGVFDVMIIDSNGVRSPVLFGTIKFHHGVTDPA